MRDRLLATLVLAALGVAVTGLVVTGSDSQRADAAPVPDDAATATFAGGCFWCTEAAFDTTEGVYAAVSGYTGGTVEDPSYEDVTSGTTGHFEAVRISYDPARISYDELVEIYWYTIDPTDAGGQLFDRGTQYRTAIFYHDEEQRAIAEASRAALDESGRFDAPVVTQILEAVEFYPAEEYHQDFYLKAPDYYEAYLEGSGRYPFLERIWGEVPDEG